MLPVNSSHNQIDWGPTPSPSRLPIDFSPPLIAIVVVVATAFFIVAYFRLISRHLLPPLFLLLHRLRLRYRRRYSPSSRGDIESNLSNISNFIPDNSTFHYFSSYNGLGEDVIKTIPLSIYTKISKTSHDCAVCLVEFEENDYVRTLPICSHAFHVECIDIWLTTHANCPLCRAGIFRLESLMASRIRPSLDGILESFLSETRSVIQETEISDQVSSQRITETEERSRNNVLKRSYSFGFERSLATTDRIVLEAVTATPWRYRRGNHLWTKRHPSPFLGKGSRVFSFRRGMKSPFIFRRRHGFFPLSESNARYHGGGGSSRRTKSMTMASPMFMRSTGGNAAFSSSRLRCGDLEALLSPERLNNRRWR
ncbi:hypothetical protein IFM89_010919 [Coptis chinensis]|uniref:RING-type E3 ubiquitin transferase n=1 Tax=Coptis chinensis TaxID=261450 RepID=A0A835MAU2_9MAGN|nr:hypothetical protein IFM89_010919 [Coptis chinensis]